MLNVLEGYPMKEWGFRSARAIHHQVEAMRHAYVDRNGYLGDPGLREESRRALPRQGIRGAHPRGDRSAKATPSASLRVGVPPHEGMNTTHYSIVDRSATRWR
jgi:gamma-glutamyltranspeptidase/glutathione hydrolase